MTHPATFTHPADPPKHPNATNSPWSIPGAVKRLGELWADHSATQIAAILTQEFQAEFSRNSIVGKLRRLRLTTDIPAKPRLTIVRTRPEAAPLQCIEVEALNLSLADLPDNGCRYIAGDDHLFCGHPQQERSSYCPDHHKLVWLPATPPKRRAA